jgi:CheY-like chemotaxis protein
MISSPVDIVVVEDDPNDAELITRAFKKHNLSNQIVLLTDGAKALDFFFCEGDYADSTAMRTPKVVLLDLKLPKIDGIEVLQRLKADERTKNIPVVILTSSSEERDIKAAYELGVNSYVTKPIKFDEFAQVVSELRLYWLLINRPIE